MSKPWNEYSKEYREKNPETVKRWRYNNCKNYVTQYELEHPDAEAMWQEEREIRRLQKELDERRRARR